MGKWKKHIGLPPGSLVYTGNKESEKVWIHNIKYNQDSFEHKVFDNQSETIVLNSHITLVNWYDIRGINDLEVIKYFGELGEIHPLILEDIPDVNQRPKFEDYDNGSFLIVKALQFNENFTNIFAEQVAIYFKKDFVISFQETGSDLFELVRNRIDNSKGRVRIKGADYLAYILVDIIVDQYFLILDKIDQMIESLEDKILSDQNDGHKTNIHNLKKEVFLIRKSILPLREAIGKFIKSENEIVEENTRLFIRDLYDHIFQAIDMVETQLQMLNGLHDLFTSEVSIKTNKVMQMLTLIATIFIPLTFLAGIYGMNFKFMPELEGRYSYFILVGVMLVILVALMIYFRKKKWI